MPAVLTVDPRSGVPIYLQIVEQVKRSVALGVLGAGEQLPTVKQLALDLTVNPNTVARAYRDLERDSVIETSPDGDPSYAPKRRENRPQSQPRSRRTRSTLRCARRGQSACRAKRCANFSTRHWYAGLLWR